MAGFFTREKGRLAALLIAGIGFGAAPARGDDAQSWNALVLSGPPREGSRLLLWFDGHARFRDNVERLGVSILRPGLGWRASERVSLWAGGARIVSRAEGLPSVGENRAWQQAIVRLPDLGALKLTSRSRLEQRFVETGDDVGWRARQFLRLERPLQEKLALVAWDEVFVAFNDTDWGASAGYDQNRFFLGPAWKPNPQLRLEAGYFLNHIRREQAPDDILHALSLTLFVNL